MLRSPGWIPMSIVVPVGHWWLTATWTYWEVCKVLVLDQFKTSFSNFVALQQLRDDHEEVDRACETDGKSTRCFFGICTTLWIYYAVYSFCDVHHSLESNSVRTYAVLNSGTDLSEHGFEDAAELVRTSVICLHTAVYKFHGIGRTLPIFAMRCTEKWMTDYAKRDIVQWASSATCPIM